MPDGVPAARASLADPARPLHVRRARAEVPRVRDRDVCAFRDKTPPAQPGARRPDVYVHPTRDEARRFLVDAWRKHRAGEPLSPLEQQAAGLIALHPEYHAMLERPSGTSSATTRRKAATVNPFLHLSLHLAVAEQLAIDQPPGIRAQFERLRAATRRRARRAARAARVPRRDAVAGAAPRTRARRARSTSTACARQR